MTRPAPLPFRSVTSRIDARSHLVVSSPALRAARPDQLPGAALCGQPVAGTSPVPVHDVQCERCLWRTPAFLGLPAWEVAL